MIFTSSMLIAMQVRKAHRAAIVELRFSEDDGFLVTGGDDTVSKVSYSQYFRPHFTLYFNISNTNRFGASTRMVS